MKLRWRFVGACVCGGTTAMVACVGSKVEDCAATATCVEGDGAAGPTDDGGTEGASPDGAAGGVRVPHRLDGGASRVVHELAANADPPARADALASDRATEPGCDARGAPRDDACVIDERYGVFVAPDGDDDGGSGTRAAPYATLAKGLVAANAAGKRLYACDDGTGYAEQVRIGAALDGVHVYGGFACAGWSYGATKAKVEPAGAGVVLAIDAVRAGVVVEDFDLEARDAESAGGSSVAVLVHASSGVVLRGLMATAGNGADGSSGSEAAEPAANGIDGRAGADACAASPNLGGTAPEMSCRGAATSGGAGGTGGTGFQGRAGESGGSGLPGTLHGGQPGYGERIGGYLCDDDADYGGRGRDGAPGGMGAAGSSARGLGTLDATGFVGVAGQPGGDGAPGQGGGGGGGARAPLECPNLPLPTGASGGSGSTGGCGGRGGGGGGPGGASVAVVSVASSVTLDGCELRSARGGRGGDGGAGQRGGAGGEPARGGKGAVVSGTPVLFSSSGCPGGRGGAGGSGGPGGGGAGGHSIGIAYTGLRPALIGGSIDVGIAGVPGVAAASEGSGAAGGDRGQRGVVEKTKAF